MAWADRQSWRSQSDSPPAPVDSMEYLRSLDLPLGRLATRPICETSVPPSFPLSLDRLWVILRRACVADIAIDD